MWPFTKKKKPEAPKRALKFKTTSEETQRLCQLLDAWESARVCWESARALSKVQSKDPLASRRMGPEECKFLYFSECARLCRLRIAEEDKNVNPPWPATFSYSFERKGNAFCFTVEGDE